MKPEKLPVSLLRPSQIDTADFIIKTPACAVFSKMGFGKTASGITAIEKLFNQGEINKLLIVSTKNVALETWPNELRTWEHASKLKFVNIAGPPEIRLQQAITPAHIYIINQENFVWLVEKAGKKWPFNMVVFDDVSGFSSGQRKTKSARCKFSAFCLAFKPGAPFGCAQKHIDAPNRCKNYTEGPRRFTRFGALCAIRGQIKRIVHFTGTPTGKNLLDLWPLIFSLDRGARLKRTISDYKTAYFSKAHNGYTWQLKAGAAKTIVTKLKDICIYLPSEAKTLPAFHIGYKIKLPEEAENLYKKFAREMVINIEDTGEFIEAANNGVLAGKLLQICGGAVFKDAVEGRPKEWLTLHDEKIKAVSSIMNKHPKEPILIGYNFTHELERLKKAFPIGQEIRKVKDVENNWNGGKIPILFAHPLSAGHGLNLQKGPGRVLIWFTPNWSLKLTKQLNKRLPRPGQKREVYIYYIITDDKADLDVMEGVAKYDYTQQQLLEAVKRRINNT